mmetsp:Transcript_29117/g.44788  ORF Transcript_29117/g.44788 Transcript_29117/m.44788 type:complete len:93 (+) Transcript_29117:104-382(+)
MVTEFCGDGDLANFEKKKGGRIPEMEAIQILQDVLKGLQNLCEKHIVHRDLKPENILKHGNCFKVADFGFSKMVEDDQNLASVVGTPLFMSP